jgi:adenine/guanine phosphoribosyltransferase-like PRPP-binding protein
MQEDALSKGQKVMIVDDLIATGGEIYFCQKLFIKSDHFLPYQVH